MKRRRKISLAIALCTLLSIGVGAAAVLSGLQRKIAQRLEKGWILTPLEVYSRGPVLSVGRTFPLEDLEREFRARDWRAGREYQVTNTPECASHFGIDAGAARGSRCLWIRSPAAVVTFDDDHWTREIWIDQTPATDLALFPRLLTQFHDGHPILQQNTTLGQVPLSCLQAVTAIEDREFLDHRGVSATGTLRALMRNVRQGRWAEGGSTITQQLVKNFFLTARKTLRRKFEEQALAVLLESQISKDQILEMYLNVIYMGQSGPYQVRGIGSAARRYFDRAIEDLELPECAMLAALINSPGRYSPLENPAAARQRRELVLKKMLDGQMITPAEFEGANSTALPSTAAVPTPVHAPYFVMSALREFQNWDLDAEDGVRLFTTLDVDAQADVTAAVAQTLPLVERKIRRPSTQPLQVATVTVDLQNARIVALTGGRDYRRSQYNRATDARRQIGSTVKPFVYYPAMANETPLSTVVDEPFEWKVGRQTWKPKNYESTSAGAVPYFYALADSLNVPAAKIGREVGLDAVAAAIGAAGIRAEVPHLPSLTLGAFELSLAELAQGYVTLARFGAGEYVHALSRAESLAGAVLFAREPTTDLKLDAPAAAVVISMLRQTVEFGTARSVRAAGLAGDYAGKTGTTSDTKDAWFVGFDGRLLTAVWVGYDDNHPSGLTGASGALPIWIEITRRLRARFEPRDFTWPAGTEERTVSREDVLRTYPNLVNLPESIRLLFKTKP